MFAGKTTEMIRRIAVARASGVVLRVLRPARDTRSNPGAIQTHAGALEPAVEVNDADQVVTESRGARAVFIDEIHFFGRPLVAPCRALVASGAAVTVAGVDIDHFGLPFEPFPDLVAMATEVTRLQGTCARCGRPSTRTQRLAGTTDRIVVGGPEMYEARCEACFVPSVGERVS
jgi:thymidine kinase